MKLLERISVRNRLVSVLGIWIAVFVFFGILSIKEMNMLGNMTRSLYNHSLPVSNAAVEARVSIIKVQRDLRDLILSRDIEELESLSREIDKTDKIVLDNLDIIKNQTSLQNNRDLEKEVRQVFTEWQKFRGRVIELVRDKKIDEANDLIKSKNNNFVENIEALLGTIDANSTLDAENLAVKSKEIEKRESTLLITIITITTLAFVVVIIFVIRSIITPINTLQQAMDKSIATGKLDTVVIGGNNEISRMAKYYNNLVQKLMHNFFIKDNQNKLSEKISACDTLEEFAEATVGYLARVTSAGKGVFYVYDKEHNKLELKGTFAFTEEDKPRISLSKGQGIIGQVALEKQPIILKGAKEPEGIISSGIIRESANNIYAFPLMYKEELYGVIELASLESFEEKTLEFLNSSANIIGINLYSAIQRQEIKKLLTISEEARKEADEKSKELECANESLQLQQEYLQQQSEELEQTNAELEEQQQLLQQQSEELQQTNAELEEQQQLLQQQSEEMQQTNSILEEQQEQLNEQKSLLEEQNRILEEYTKELSRKTQELEMTNKYKSEFLSNMSHELRTPLNSIILLSKLLLDKSKDRLIQGDEEKITVINKSGQELLRLINDVLDLSKVESGAMTLDKYGFSSSSISKEMKDMFSNVALDKGLEFIAKDSLNKDLYGDEHKISQILRNLISNAIKFTSKGYVSFEIKEDTKLKGAVLFAIKDTGIGISEEKQNIIFNEFQQVDGSVSRKYGGTGLGLSISKKLTALMDGEIEVNSIFGKGSEFILRVPGLVEACKDYDISNSISENILIKDSESQTTLENCEEHYSNRSSEVVEEVHKQIDKIDNNTENYLLQSIKRDNLSLKGKTILIVDDDPRNIFTLASTLEEHEGTVIEASNGRIALEKLEKQDIDLVLMDIMMPEMDGYEAMQHIRKNPRYINLPIIAVTAKSLKEEREKCIAMGADDYISKPVDYDNLIRIIKAWINKQSI
ncbi:signal transduction histidine kinase/ActR/RegA family two-component response regulator [Clostridium punense]|uniref:Stage 0 sporulation protein A homolog n=2 Tax=Clostridium TaxID=1485 RepID=A0ABS4K3R0_9CLOT|nr:response regulator [Clostridium punense]MBP2022418.1 signal transduction histidine kinase/ActR/RegA family two-component response regulator [Clostridium punense]